ncbi:MAG: TolC family protein [Candidatus Eremiobacteraeota bacterium]|nr:TolC family protein [Candidatus Eremiobacteraeota bacterium]
MSYHLKLVASIVLATSWCSAIAPAAALSTRTQSGLDAAGTIRYALAHAPAMLAKRATVANLLATFTQRRVTEFPTLAGQLQNQIARSSGANGSFAQFGIAPVSNFSQNTAQILSQYNLYNGSVQIASEQAKRNVENAAADLQRQGEATALDAANGYYNLVARREAVNNAVADLAFQQQLLDKARASEKVGRVAGVDVLRAQVAVARSQSNLVQARADEENAREALGVQIGASPDTTFALPATLPEPAVPRSSVESLATIAAASRPEIAGTKAVLQAAKLGDAAVDTDLRPTVQMNGAFGSQVSPTSFVQQQASIANANASALANYNLQRTLFPNVNFPVPATIPGVVRGRPGFWQFGIVSTFTLPFVDYGTRAANHRAARAQIDAAQAQFDNTLDAVESDVRASLRNARAAFEKLGLAKQSGSLAAESARIALLQYQNGLISFSDVTQTQATAVSAENDLTAARVAYILSLVKLRLALGPADPTSAVTMADK